MAFAAVLLVIGLLGTTSWDRSVHHALFQARTGGVTAVARVLTALGSSPVAFVAVLAAGAWRWRRSGWHPLVAAVALLWLGELARATLNEVVARPRPLLAERAVAASAFTWPSGHSFNALLASGLVALLLGGRRWWWWALAGLVAVVVGATRVWLGVHWPTDVLGGWAMAAMWLAISAVVLRRAGVSRAG